MPFGRNWPGRTDHLSVCAECHEEYEALLRALKAMDL
jgi:hypothetical protein